MISFAPMEGLATCYYRRVHHRLFPEGVGRYYTPFLSVTRSTSDRSSDEKYAFHKRDLREVRPAEDETEEDSLLRKKTVPQILARTAPEILWAAEKLSGLGYREINLNLGCPSATVVKKGGGAGMLADPDLLDRVFDAVYSDPLFEKAGICLSAKTRLGLNDPAEFTRILPVFNHFPLKEIILHPRVRAEQYGGKPHREILAWALEHTKISLAYNGNLFSPEEIVTFRAEFPSVKHIMLGRGIVSDPALARELAGGPLLTMRELSDFVRALTEEYRNILDNEHQLLLKLKELWFYLGALFVDQKGLSPERLLRDLRSARNMSEYRNAVYALRENCTLGKRFRG
ncbi:MAG: tRNA-dihydrouridine synthase family protein [Lachnospiraceae bacterium]|nr:tRNA-dihydrouridine synthase family protein [Lachnospiraceae bacterium]